MAEAGLTGESLRGELERLRQAQAELAELTAGTRRHARKQHQVMAWPPAPVTVTWLERMVPYLAPVMVAALLLNLVVVTLNLVVSLRGI